MLSIAEAQVKTRTATVLAPRKTENQFEQEFQKGEIAGISLFTKLPGMAIADIEQQVKEQENAEPTAEE